MTQQNMQVDEFDLSDAPEMPSGIFTNYGKLTLTQKYGVWRNGKLEEASKDDFKRTPAKVEGRNAKQIDMVFTVDIQEFKPSLQFTYERKVTVNGVDWNKIVVPSIEAVFGKGSMANETSGATLSKLNGKYVAFQDVPQTPTKKQPDRSNYNTFKLVAVFESREACYKAFVEAGGSSTANGSTSPALDPMVPNDYSNELWYSMKGELSEKVDKAIADALAQLKSKAPPVVTKAKADAKAAAIQKLSEDYAATPEQVLHLIGE